MAVFAVNFKAAHMFFKPLGDNVDVSPSQVGVEVNVLAAQLSVSTSCRRRATPAFIWSLYESNIHFPVDEIDIWLFSCLKLHRAHEPVAVFVGLMFNAGQVEAQCVYSELPAVAWNKVIGGRNRKAEIKNSELKDAKLLIIICGFITSSNIFLMTQLHWSVNTETKHYHVKKMLNRVSEFTSFCQTNNPKTQRLFIYWHEWQKGSKSPI